MLWAVFRTSDPEFRSVQVRQRLPLERRSLQRPFARLLCGLPLGVGSVVVAVRHPKKRAGPVHMKEESIPLPYEDWIFLSSSIICVLAPTIEVTLSLILSMNWTLALSFITSSSYR